MRNRDTDADLPTRRMLKGVTECPRCGSYVKHITRTTTESFDCSKETCGWSYDRDIPRYIGDPISEDES
jgi:ssDNA-binding Zn-finger/Zn-ribbon topoisomerase 1